MLGYERPRLYGTLQDYSLTCTETHLGCRIKKQVKPCNVDKGMKILLTIKDLLPIFSSVFYFLWQNIMERDTTVM